MSCRNPVSMTSPPDLSFLDFSTFSLSLQDDHLLFKFLSCLLQPRCVCFSVSNYSMNSLLCLLISFSSSLIFLLLSIQGSSSSGAHPAAGTWPPWASAGLTEPLWPRTSPRLSSDIPALQIRGGCTSNISSTFTILSYGFTCGGSFCCLSCFIHSL